jgi:FdhD protein
MIDQLQQGQSTIFVNIIKHKNGHVVEQKDEVAVESPLQMEVNDKPVSITMRTPGDDIALTVGFLFTEGILRRYEEIQLCEQKDENTVNVVLKPGVFLPKLSMERNFYSTSSCGVCGKSSLEQLAAISEFMPVVEETKVEGKVFLALQEKLLQVQETFEKTGGIHACALFDLDGKYIMHKEDVGRHNALDKLIGECFILHRLPIKQSILLLSGRTSFELVQKACMAGIAIIAAVGAPSSLAVSLAVTNKQTLIGFLRTASYNIYSESSKVIL